jgi:hypothetical protein
LDHADGPEGEAMDAIWQLYKEGALALMLLYSVQAEIEHPHTPAEVKRKAGELVFSEEVELVGPELAIHDASQSDVNLTRNALIRPIVAQVGGLFELELAGSVAHAPVQFPCAR